MSLNRGTNLIYFTIMQILNFSSIVLHRFYWRNWSHWVLWFHGASRCNRTPRCPGFDWRYRKHRSIWLDWICGSNRSSWRSRDAGCSWTNRAARTSWIHRYIKNISRSYLILALFGPVNTSTEKNNMSPACASKTEFESCWICKYYKAQS